MGLINKVCRIASPAAWLPMCAPAAMIWASLGMIAHAAPENVFLGGVRNAVVHWEQPSIWVGRLDSDAADSYCSAGLVYRDIIVTAAHCVMDKVTHELKKTSFAFSLAPIGGKALVIATAKPFAWGTKDPQSLRSEDWALLRLDQTLGDRYGWLRVVARLASELLPEELSITAYSGDWMSGWTPSIEHGCTFSGVWQGSLLHNCSMTPGASGSPIYTVDPVDEKHSIYQMVALNVAERRPGNVPLIDVPYSSDVANVAVLAERILPALEKQIAAERAEAAARGDTSLLSQQ